jgi:16S rRNA G966 N2-methylase RsmD
LEYDKRFNIFENDYIEYDYRDPSKIHQILSPQSIDFIIVDPPFLSHECFEKITEIINYLLKEDGKFIICTGKTIESFLETKFSNIHTTSFHPKHNNPLSNPFVCLASYITKWDEP